MLTQLKAKIVAIIMVIMPLMGATVINKSALHDPTEPPPDFMPAVKNNEISYRSMNLNAIFIKPNARWAVINGQVYHEGDAVGEYIITNIHVDTVELIDSAHNKEVLELVTPIKKMVVPAKESRDE